MALSFSDLLGFAQGAGFTGGSATTIAAIAMAESGGDPNAINLNDPGGSYGLTQINAAAHGPTAIDTLGNPALAFQQAFEVSQGGTSFTPWSAFNSGKYLGFLPGASQTNADNPFPPSSPFSGESPVTNDPQFNPVPSSPSPTNPGAPGSNPDTGGAPLPLINPDALSAMSKIFAAIGDLFQRGGFIILGVVLLAIGAYAMTRGKSAA